MTASDLKNIGAQMKALRYLALALPLVLPFALAWADGPYKYNPYTSRWELPRSDSDPQYKRAEQSGYTAPSATRQYNPYENRWEATPPKFDARYNPYNNRWEAPRPEAQFGYDRNQGTWRYLAPGTGAQYNPHSRRWEYPR